MAIEQVNQHLQHPHHHHQNQTFLLDEALYCEEEQEENWGEEEFEENKSNSPPQIIFPLFLYEQDLFYEDEQLNSLLIKEEETHCSFNNIESNPCLCEARKEAVAWIVKVNGHYGFSALTAIFAINYLDRFVCNLHYQEDKPWMIQLAAVTCLSLAAKVEETYVPLLLDFQVEDAKYAFDAKTIQKMELLVLSTLKWRMNPVTPFSFLHLIIRRLGLKNHLHWEFLKRCESLILSVVADSRFVLYLPSVLASATVLHVIHQVEPCNAIDDYHNQLLHLLKINKEKVNACYDLISEISDASSNAQNISHKRKYNQVLSSPNGVIDTHFCSNNSNDSWEINPSAVSSPQPFFKKNQVDHEQLRLSSLSCRVFIDALGSPL